MPRLIDIGKTLYVSIPKQTAKRLGWKKGTEVAVDLFDAVQKKVVVEEMKKN